MGHHDGVIDVEGQVLAPNRLTQRSTDLARLDGYFFGKMFDRPRPPGLWRTSGRPSRVDAPHPHSPHARGVPFAERHKSQVTTLAALFAVPRENRLLVTDRSNRSTGL